MTNFVVTIKCRFDDELREYISTSILNGIPVGDLEKLEIELEYLE